MADVADIGIAPSPQDLVLAGQSKCGIRDFEGERPLSLLIHVEDLSQYGTVADGASETRHPRRVARAWHGS
jgi:hypothetical protein